VESVRKSLPAGVSVEVKSAGRLYGVYGDEAMLGSAIRDLCANSAEAMPNGGRIVVETENATLDEEFCRKYPWARRGDYVRLSVRDDGSGIPENIRRRVFEPFFTTKESGGGLGLGLSLAYTATKRHDGFLNLASEEGKGTVVDIYLPRDIEGEKPARPAAAAGLSRRTILIAEDEELVRKIAIKVLENAGFDVLVARDGEEACELFNDNADRISLAFLDISMPRKNGKEVYRLISGARPGLPVVFSSGYGYSALEGGADDLPNTPMVRKPYTPSELVRQLREALGDPAS
jgi:CheY-like chemotaxis protein